ncbi:hypothetical protein AHF37_09805 [Paragonimus kellicotti]|nr:hypothetical protein AHF37_09805 [Paragonimus kellicotti]
MSVSLNIDEFIKRLLDSRHARPGTLVNMKEEEIRILCHKSREIFLSQPVLLELESPVQICGKYNHVFITSVEF